MSWLRVMAVLIVATAIGCEARSLDPDAGTGSIPSGIGGAGSIPSGAANASGSGGAAGAGGFDARPDIPTIQPSEPSLCGNGRPDPGEQCDDYNKSPRDGCSPICQIECFESCGVCGSGGPCPVFCGNGRLDTREACDDGNAVGGDGCSQDCAIEPGWHCPVFGRRCAPICGDGRVVYPETCDDSNTDPGDGCSGICVLEPRPDPCGDGVVEGSEECDFGSANSDTFYGECGTDCRWGAHCGDGVTNGPEDCDLGAGRNLAGYGDAGGCTPGCTAPHFCGDGYVDVETGEQCDLGVKNGESGQPCKPTCKICIDCL